MLAQLGRPAWLIPWPAWASWLGGQTWATSTIRLLLAGLVVVGLVLGLLADGMTIEELLAEYPSLSDDDIRACLAYGARLSVGHYVDVA